jgi:hypothetical protein
MESLELRCLEKLNKILSKFDLKIDIVNLEPLNIWQYRFIDNSINKADWKAVQLGSWLSLNDLLFNQQSIFECLEPYYNVVNKINNFNFLPNVTCTASSTYQRYSEVYQFIQPLKSCCLEEFLIRCDLIGI